MRLYFIVNLAGCDSRGLAQNQLDWIRHRQSELPNIKNHQQGSQEKGENNRARGKSSETSLPTIEVFHCSCLRLLEMFFIQSQMQNYSGQVVSCSMPNCFDSREDRTLK